MGTNLKIAPGLWPTLVIDMQASVNVYSLFVDAASYFIESPFALQF